MIFEKWKMAALTHLPKMEIKKISLSKYFLSQSEYHLSCKSDTWIVKKVKVKKNYDLLSQKGFFSRSLHSDIWLKRNKKNFMSLKSEFWLTIPDHFQWHSQYVGKPTQKQDYIEKRSGKAFFSQRKPLKLSSSIISFLPLLWAQRPISCLF